MRHGPTPSHGLLLVTNSVGPQGPFTKITSIQRVNTVGGVAPENHMFPIYCRDNRTDTLQGRLLLPNREVELRIFSFSTRCNATRAKPLRRRSDWKAGLAHDGEK